MNYENRTCLKKKKKNNFIFCTKEKEEEYSFKNWIKYKNGMNVRSDNRKIINACFT